MATYKKVLHFVPGTPMLSPVALPIKPVLSWVKDESTGKSAPRGPQAVDSNGVPLWTGSALMMSDAFGSAEAEVVDIVFSSHEKPSELPADVFDLAL